MKIFSRLQVKYFLEQTSPLVFLFLDTNEIVLGVHISVYITQVCKSRTLFFFNSI